VLANARPQYLQRDHDEAAANAEETAQEPAQEPDRGEDRAAVYSDYSGALIGGSGWLDTTEWCRNWTSAAG